MTWTIPQPGDIADRAASLYEELFPGADARSTNSLFAASARTTGEAGFDVYLYQARLAVELMPDTALDWLPRHGSIWGVPQGQPAAAIGNVIFSAPADFTVPAGVLLTAPSGVTFQTTAPGTVAGGGNSVSVPAAATTTGAATDVGAGVVLTLVAPLIGLTAQAATTDGDGLEGGLDLESPDSWRARILARIRQPPDGGSAQDYVEWVQEVLPSAIVAVIGGYVGPGSVGVIVAGPGPSVVTGAQVTAIQAHLNAVRPVTAAVYVLAATLHPVAFDYALTPNTLSNQANAAAALALWMSQDAAIGGTLEMSRADNAVSTAAGVYSLERSVPNADVTVGATEIPVLGALTWS